MSEMHAVRCMPVGCMPMSEMHACEMHAYELLETSVKRY